MLGGDIDELADDAAAFGLVLPTQPADEFELWPEHVPAVELFYAVQTQWRVLPSGHFQGLDYPAVESLMRMRRYPVKQRAALLAELQIMELAALAVWRD